MAEPSAPVDNADPAPAPSSAEPAAPPASQEPAPSGREPDNNSGSGEPAMVPSDRLREETEKRRKAEERLAELEANPPTPPAQPSDDVQIDDDTEKLLDSYAKKRGLVSQEELAAERGKIQVQQDVNDLTANPPNPGIPYDNKEVMDYARDNNMPITSKAAFRAAYRELNYDKIVEATKQNAIEGYKKAGSSGAETPSSAGAQAPVEPKLDPKLSPKERTRERIKLARERLSI